MYRGIILVIIFVFIGFYMNHYHFWDFSKFSKMKIINQQNEELGGSYLYNDAGLIQLLHSIKDLSHYSPASYKSLIRYVDKFLFYSSLCHEDSSNISEVYDEMLVLKKNALNEMGSFYLKIQEPEEEKQLYKAIDSLRYLLNIHLNEIKVLNKNNPINRNFKDVCSNPYEPIGNAEKDHLMYLQLF